MNTAGDAADQVVRYSLEAGEVALKLTGEGAKELAVLLYTILKEEKKTTGKAKLETLIRSGKPLTVFSVKKENMKKFEQEAKKYGIMYYPIPNSEKDGLYDVMVKEEDSPRINRLVERFKLTTVADASDIKKEITNSKDVKEQTSAGQEVPAKDTPEKAQEDKLVDELLGKPIKKEEQTTGKPPLGKPKNASPYVNTSEKQNRTAEGTSKKSKVVLNQKPSVKEKLQEIKAAKAKENVAERQVPEQKKEQTKSQRSKQYNQPKSKKKSNKAKVR